MGLKYQEEEEEEEEEERRRIKSQNVLWYNMHEEWMDEVIGAADYMQHTSGICDKGIVVLLNGIV